MRRCDLMFCVKRPRIEKSGRHATAAIALRRPSLADGYLRRWQIRPRERIEIDALNAIAAFVHQGLGVSLVPDWTPPWPEGLQVARIALPPPVPIRRMGIVWTTQGPRAALARTLLDLAQTVWASKG